MASEVKEETNSTPSEIKNAIDEVKDDNKIKAVEKESGKVESKEENETSAIEESKKSNMDEDEDDDDDDDDDDEEEEEVGLLDRPVEVTGCRARKKVERLEMSFTPKREKQEFQEGKGKKLGECPRIEMQIQKLKVLDLRLLHRILFKKTASTNAIKKNIRKFSGFPFDKDSVEFNRKRASLDKLSVSDLKKICVTLDIERMGSKTDLVNRILNFLLNPEDSGKKVPSTKKKAPKEKKKRASKKIKSEKKVKSEKDENSADDPEESEEADSTGEEASMGGTDEENEAENVSDEEPKKKSKDTKTSKNKSKVDKVKKEEKKSKGNKRKHGDDSSASSTDEPVAKKAKMPSDDEISKLVKQILESADLQEITMKKVIKQVSDAYPDFDLSHKKAFIKSTIKSVIS